MTEDEAKSKWCPFSRTLDFDHADQAREQPVAASVNRTPGNYDREGNETVVVAGRHRCIGSACAAWRWNGYFDGDTFMHRRSRSHWSSDKMKQPAGFCGLAGLPQ